MSQNIIPGVETDPSSQINQWTGQLVYASLNMGDIKRSPHIPHRAQKIYNKDERSLLVEFLRKCPAHIMCLAEAAGIQQEEMRRRLCGWKFVSSYDENLAVGVRSDGSASINILYDSTDPTAPGGREYHDDPTLPLSEEKYLWYLIVELDFGIINASDHRDYQGKGSAGAPSVRSSGRVNKASFEKVRVLAFHINNVKAAKSPYSTRLRLRQLFLDVARYQVDILGGDANGAMYRYFPQQPIPSIAQSSFVVMLKTLIAAINSCVQDPRHKVHADFISSNAQDKLDRFQKLFTEKSPEVAWKIIEEDDGGIDCVVGVTISWGHSATATRWRESVDTTLLTALADPLLGYSEFVAKVAEFPLLLTNRHLWLNTAGNGDCSWHSPLIVRLRLQEDQNKRKRSAAAQEARNERYQTFLARKGQEKGKGKEAGKTAGKGKGKETGKEKGNKTPAPPAHPPSVSSSSSSWRPSVPWGNTASSSSSSSAWQNTSWQSWNQRW
jgi:hypothetical protein